MDGSRRYSKIYCKTQAGTDALTAGRGALSSSARQLLILLDGVRDFDELSHIFGEETLYRLLPFLESQGFVEPMNERATAQNDPAAPSTTRRSDTPTAASNTIQTPITTVSQVVAPPATLSEALPVQRSAKSQRFLAVPIAILVSLATAAAIVSWVFERELHDPENPPQVQASAKPPASAGDASKQPLASAGSIAPGAKPRTAQSDSSSAISEPTHPPAPVAAVPLPSVQLNPMQASAPVGETGSLLASRGKTNSESTVSSSKSVMSEAAAQSNEANSRPAQRAKAVSDSTLDASKQSAPAARTQLVESAARVVARPKAATDPAKDSAKESATQSDISSATRQGTLALAAPDHVAAQSPALALATTGLHVRSRVLPGISKRALESGIYGGKAVVRLHVNSAGAVERVELVSAIPPEVYGPDVQQALQQWTFEPPSNPAQFTLELDFREQPPAPAASASKPPDGP